MQNGVLISFHLFEIVNKQQVFDMDARNVTELLRLTLDPAQRQTAEEQLKQVKHVLFIIIWIFAIFATRIAIEICWFSDRRLFS